MCITVHTHLLDVPTRLAMLLVAPIFSLQYCSRRSVARSTCLKQPASPSPHSVSTAVGLWRHHLSMHEYAQDIDWHAQCVCMEVWYLYWTKLHSAMYIWTYQCSTLTALPSHRPSFAPSLSSPYSLTASLLLTNASYTLAVLWPLIPASSYLPSFSGYSFNVTSISLQLSPNSPSVSLPLFPLCM